MLSVDVEAVLLLPAASCAPPAGTWRSRCRPGHAADGDVVGRAAAGDDLVVAPRRATERDVAAVEAGDGLAEDDREVDRRGVRRIGLARGLVDRHRRRRRVARDRVVGRGRGRVVLPAASCAPPAATVAITVPSPVMPLTATL